MTSRRNLATLLKFFDNLLLYDLRLILLISTINLPRDWVHFLVQTFLLLGFLSFCRVFLAQNKAALQPEKILKYEDDLCPCVELSVYLYGFLVITTELSDDVEMSEAESENMSTELPPGGWVTLLWSLRSSSSSLSLRVR